MKHTIALAAGIGMIAAAPAFAGANTVFATWEDCVAAAEAAGSGSFSNHTYVCSPTADGGWEVVWTRIKRERQTRGGGKTA